MNLKTLTSVAFLSIFVCSGFAQESAGPEKIKRVAVRSTLLDAVGYDARSQTLELVFDSGSVRRLAGVPAAVYKALLAAPSKGKFYHKQLRGKYVATKPPTQ